MEEPFGGIAFDPKRALPQLTLHVEEAITNGDRANDGCTSLRLFAALGDPSGARSVLEDIADEISLSEAPDEALTDLLTNLMHYCHREGIEFYGNEGALPRAQRHFAKESGGAAL